MSTMSVLIATAENEIFRGEASKLIAYSVEGELAIIPGHAPLLATLRPGELRIDCLLEGGRESCKTDIVVFGGFLEVQPDSVIVLADAIERAKDIDIVQAKRAVERAKKQLASHDKNTSVKAILALEVAIAKLRVARRNSKQSLLKP